MTNPAQEILDLIENGDLENQDTRLELDCRVHHYAHDYDNGVACWGNLFDAGKYYKNPPPEYTRSRDALKAIRPEGWTLYIDDWKDEKFRFGAFKANEVGFDSPLLAEELAELHAIIQAIAYERENA